MSISDNITNKPFQEKYVAIGFGAYFAFISAGSLLFMPFQRWVITQLMDGSPSMKSHHALFIQMFDLFSLYMPYLFAIGITYIVFGLVIHRYYIFSFVINTCLFLIMLIWTIYYVEALQNYVTMFLENFTKAFPIDFFITYWKLGLYLGLYAMNLTPGVIITIFLIMRRKITSVAGD